MAVRQQESVAAFPFRRFRPIMQRVPVGDGEDVGHAKGLADIALALDFAHAQGEAADAVGRAFQGGVRMFHVVSPVAVVRMGPV